LQRQKKKDARAHQHRVQQPEPPVIHGAQVRAGFIFNSIHVRIRKADWLANARFYGGGENHLS
jgi:hypothetical protein